MRMNVYISSDYSEDNGDRDVVEILNKWGSDEVHKVNFIDMAKVASGSVSQDSDCRPCELKQEFNQQINKSSAVIFVIGDKTSSRTAGSTCSRYENDQYLCSCTPYKQNANGSKKCKVKSTIPARENVGNINNYSHLQHEFEQAKKKEKKIIIFYNSSRKERSWLPSYMDGYQELAEPFWIYDDKGNKFGNYRHLKSELGVE